MSALAQAQRTGFDDRIRRISRGDGPNVMGRIEVGPREEVRAYEKGKKGAKKIPLAGQRRGGGIAMLIILPLAALIGAASMFAGRIGAFHLFSGQGLYLIELPGWNIALWGDVAIGATIALMLGWAFRLGHGLRRLTLLFGFAAMMPSEAFLLQEYPEVFERIYTPAYVTAELRTPPVWF